MLEPKFQKKYRKKYESQKPKFQKKYGKIMKKQNFKKNMIKLWNLLPRETPEDP